MKKLLKEFLSDNEGMELVEYLAGGAILIALVASALYVIGQNSQSEGQNVGSYIGGINAPSHP